MMPVLKEELLIFQGHIQFGKARKIEMVKTEMKPTKWMVWAYVNLNGPD